MSSLTLLETILVVYIIAINVLGVITIIMVEYASKKASDIIFGILLVVAIPVVVPIVLYQMLVEKLKRRKRKQLDDLMEEL